MKSTTLAAITAIAFTAGGPAAFAQDKPLVGGVEKTSCTPPAYPTKALHNEESGMVHAGFLVGPDGVVLESFIVLSSGVPALDRATIAGLSKCRFPPPTAGGKPATRWSHILYVWQFDPPYRAAPDFIKRAENGSAAMQYQLALMYEAGYMVDKNEQESLRWLRKAAERGLAAAQFKLGERYEEGCCMAQDDEQAAFWYRKAAAQKNTFARDKLHFGFGSIAAVPEKET